MGTVLATFVVADDRDATVLFQPAGAPRRHRTGRRGGPSGRNMLPDGWDGGYEDSTLPSPSRIRLHPVDQAFSVIRRWDETRFAPDGWYVNLEQPWVRTPIGFDSHDDVLDIQVADDLSSWSWKDADELEWSVSVGKLTAEYAHAVWKTGRRVIGMIEGRVWPFREADWVAFVPPTDRGRPAIPEEWATTWPADPVR